MRHLKRVVVKEAFDNLPSGVCFFDRNGMVTLRNHQMHRLILDLTGRDLQHLTELEQLLCDDTPTKKREGDIFLTEDGSAWRFSVQPIETQDGSRYMQCIAANVTALYRSQKELEEDNRRLEQIGERLRRLSASITALTREEEALTMKMRVHDDIGRSVIATRRLLMQKRPTGELDLTVWKNAVRLLKHDAQSPEEQDALTELIEAAAGIGIRIHTEGTLPEDQAAAYLLVTAMRECATNAVRHAGAADLFARFFQAHGMATAVITNNGAAPAKDITEGGGLSSLRTRIERHGGDMHIRSKPHFEMTVSVPCTQSPRRPAHARATK